MPCTRLLAAALFAILPLAAHGNDLADARQALQTGDLRAARIDLRNAVRSDPQNAQAHYWLAKVSLDLGDPVAAEREVRAATARGADPHQTVPLLAASLLAQNKAKELLQELRPTGKDQELDASILIARGQAAQAQQDIHGAQTAYALAEQATPNAVGPLLAEARLLGSLGDVNGAQAKIDRALAVQPRSAEALLDEAELARRKGDTAAAMSILTRILNEQPANIRALLDRARLEIAAGQPDKAKLDIAAVQKAIPDNIQACYLQAVLQVQGRDFKSADASLDRINAFLARIPRGFLLQAAVKEYLGQPAQAEEAARRYISQAPDDLAGYKMLARLQFAGRRPDLAAEVLGGVARSGRADAETYDLLGRAYAAIGRRDESVKAFQKAQSLAPDDVGLQTRLANARVRAGQAELAMDDLEHTLQLAPTTPQVGEALFFAALATGDLRKAAEAVDAVHNAQGATPVEENLEGLLKLAQLDQPGAEKKFREIVRNHPDFATAQINLARVLDMQGKPAEAEQLLSALLQKQPTAEPALTILAARYVQTHRLSAAISLMAKAHSADPGNSRLAAALGDLYLRAGKPVEALTVANEGNGSDSIDLLELKAAVQLALDQKDQAQDTYGQILKLDPAAIAIRRKFEALLIKAGDYERARGLIKGGFAVSPRNYQLYQDYVLLDLKANGIEAAVATARELQRQDLDLRAAGALVGDVYMAANRPADAAQAYKEAMQTAPSDMLLARLNTALVRSDQKAAALDTLADWIQQHPDDPTGLRLAADLCIADKQYARATGYLQRLLEKEPHDAIALNNLAWLYQQQNDKRAEGLARQAYILSPSDQTADTLGWILVSAGDPAQGVPLLRQAAAQSSSDPRVLYHYGMALKDTGQRDAAIKVLNAAVANPTEFREKDQARQVLQELNKE